MEFVSFELAKKLKEKGFSCKYPLAMYNERGWFCPLYTSADRNPNFKSVFSNREYYDYDDFDEFDYIAPIIGQVLKWLREKNIDIEIHTECGLLGYKVYIPYVSTYEEYTLKDDSDIVRYKQKRRNTATPLPNEIIQPFDYFDSYEEAAVVGIEYTLDHLL